MRQYHRGEGLVDLVEVEVAQAKSVAGQQPRYRVGRCHQQTIGTVDVVHRSGLGVDEEGERGQRVRLCPTLAGQQCHRGAVGQRGGVSGGHGRVAGPHPEHRAEPRQGRRGGVGPQIVVAVKTEESGHEVVEESAVVGRGRVAMAGRGQLILVETLDAHLLGGDRGVFTHG